MRTVIPQRVGQEVAGQLASDIAATLGGAGFTVTSHVRLDETADALHVITATRG